MSFLKQEPIDISDSDSDRLEIEEKPRVDSSTCSDDVGVRRSARRRRTSSKLSGDFVTVADDRRAAVPSPSVAPPEKKRRVETTYKWAPPKVSLTAESIDPEALLAYVERTKRNVKPGEFAVKLAAGPDQFVTIDGAEYLRGLGYDFDLDEVKSIKKDDDKDSNDDDDLIEIIQDSQEDKRNNHLASYEERIRKIEPPSSHRLKEVVNEPDQFSSASAYSTEDERRSMSSSNSNKDIDVGTAEDQGFVPSLVNTSYLNHPNSRRNVTRQNPKRFSSSPNRQDHNLMEQARRRELAGLFSYLKSVVEPRVSTMPKVRILTEASDLISLVKQESVQLTMEKHTLELMNRRLIEQKNTLLKLAKQKEIKKGKNKKNKSVMNL